MDIDHLREFVVLGKALNFTTGARSLHLAQSTLSRHLSALEKEVGVELVHRSPNAVGLTPVGKLFLEEAIGLVDHYDEILAAVRDSQKTRVPIIRLGGALMDRGIIDHALAAMSLAKKRHLPISVELCEQHIAASWVQATANDPHLAVLGSLIDIGLMFGCESGDWGVLEHKSLYRDPFAVFVAEDHPLTRSGSVSLFDLHAETFVVLTVYPTHTNRIIEACRLAGFEPKTKTRVGASAADILIAGDEHEVFCMSQASRGLVAPTGISGLVQLEVDDPNAYFEAWAVYRKDNTSPGISIFLEVLESVSAAMTGMA